MHQLLQSYLRRLTNLSGNNRSLLLLRLSSDQCIDLQDFDYLEQRSAFGLIEELIGRSARIPLCQLINSRDEASNLVSRKLKKLQRMDRFIFEERGVKDLYVGWPFVRGKFADGTLVRCPLMFFPVALEEKNNQWILKSRSNVSITLNRNFLLAYAYYNNVTLDENLLDLNVDDWDIDSRVFRTMLYQTFRDSPVELNFNQENFIDQLQPFENFLKADFDDAVKSGQLKLYPEAVLGIFPQAGSHLVPDYVHLIENEKAQDLEEFFLSRSQPDDQQEFEKHSQAFHFLQRVREEQFITPFALDAFQENAHKAVKKGNSLVVQGPPGTGKSQFISNLIADYMAQGKNVLLVCQKRAALDVVHERLAKEGFSDFVAQVHDFRDDRGALYEKIAKQISRLHEYKQLNNGFDAIHLERDFLQCSRRIDQITEELEEYKFALFDESECGSSVKELYLTSELEGDYIVINQVYKNFNFNELPDFIRRLKAFMDYASRFERDDYPWKNHQSFASYSLKDYQRIRQVIEEVPYVEKLISRKVEDLIGVPLNYVSLETILSKSDQVEKLLQLLSDERTYDYFQHMLTYKDTDPQELRNLERVLLDCYRGDGPEVTLNKHELGDFREVLEKRLKAHYNIFLRILWFFNTSDKKWLAEVCKANKVGKKRKDTQAMVQRVDNRLNLEHNLSLLRDLGWVKSLPPIDNKIEVQNWFYYQHRALEAKLIFNSLRNFKEYFNIQRLSLKEFKEKLEKLMLVVGEWPRAKQRWLQYLTPMQITLILGDEKGKAKVLQVLKQDFDALCEYDRLKDGFEAHEEKVIEKLHEHLSGYDAEKAEKLFQNSLRLAWIEHIEIKYPVLRSISSLSIERMETELQDCVLKKQELSKNLFLLKNRERTYSNLEYNRLQNMVTYRDLLHQVSKRRKIWPLRKLLAHFSEEIFQLMPCWMASPETVSAIFPMEDVFDLVIFDEASQCFAEKGIPAMYRGKQVVVVGDSKQLQPNDLYRVRWDEEDEHEASEVNSLLELAGRYLIPVQLRGHYRSRSHDLIDFSNRHFYQGQLKMLPDMQLVNQGEPAIQYHKLDGKWEKQTNPEEARYIVDLIKKLQKEEKEVGVVTFNVRQQDCITDLLEAEVAEGKMRWPESLFVKNIENVQGDERDIIIFSIAYAPDEKGKMQMHFGSLNAEHGENRLNVAITRAREKIYVVSSIYPDQLKVEETKNEGPKLLKKYLQYALEVSEGKFKPVLSGKHEHHLEWFLARRLTQWAEQSKQEVELKEDLPFADLTIKDKQAYDGLILTDDHLYYSSVSVKEPHVYLPLQLRDKNWRFRTYYSREYWFNREGLEDKLMKYIRHVHE
jgi:superfamily I DNA and/or RNA helicase